MNKFVLNPTKAPRHYGASTIIPADNYGVVTAERAAMIGRPVLVEGDPQFRPLFVSNVPDRTPDQIP